MDFTLEIWQGGQLTGRKRITASGLSIGRDRLNQVVLADPSVSKRHARVTLKDGQVLISDLCSTAGTFVENKRIASTTLSAGGTAQIGPYQLRIVSTQVGGASDSSALELLAGRQLVDEDLGQLHALMAVTDLQAVLEALLSRALTICGADLGYVVLIHKDTFAPISCSTGPVEDADELSRTLCRRAAKSGTPIRLSPADLAADGSPSLLRRPFVQLVAIPLIESGEVLGVLHLEQSKVRPAATVTPDHLARIGMIGGQALRSALKDQQILKKKDGWQWLAKADEDRPDLFRTSVAPAMEDVGRILATAAADDVTVLIRGETGSGKDVAARSIHDLSRRRSGPFVAVNCGAIPRDLIQAELFGYEKGAFTGAQESRPGKFEMADGGTLFLDEIGDMPREVQVNLLRTLETRTVTRLGGHKSFSWDARVIAATHVNLEEAIEKGDFRQDLFYRLNVVAIDMPPLRDRPEDIGPLVQDLLVRMNRRFNRKLYGVTPAALALMQRYPWPGNVRELKNVIERAFFVEKGSVITPASLPLAAPGVDTIGDTGTPAPLAAAPLPKDKLVSLAEFSYTQERAYVQHVLDCCQGNISKAARVLDLSRVTLQRKLKQLDLRSPHLEDETPAD